MWRLLQTVKRNLEKQMHPNRAMIRNRIFGLSIFLAITSNAQNYRSERSSEHGVEIVRLTDLAHEVMVSVLPSAGNRAYEMKVHGKNILYFPYTDVSELQKRPRLCGIPFLAPWAFTRRTGLLG